MYLSITHRGHDAADLGHLLHKHPARLHETTLGFGTACVFYTAASPAECTAVLAVDVDPVGLVRSDGARQGGWALGQYVNDRPYAASSFLSVAISRVFGTALNGRCTKRPELVDKPLDLEARLPVIQAPEGVLEKIFAPLGYEVISRRLPLESAFPSWGESRYHDLTLRATRPLYELLRHLFVLIPALDRDKHYWVGPDEIDKLLAKGEGWLAGHPERDWIVRRYLKYQRRLTNEAISRLVPEDEAKIQEGMKPGALRHGDHRFEWTRAEFKDWAERVAASHGYGVTLEPLGEEHPEHGAPSQMAVFSMP